MSVTELCSETWANLLLAMREDYHAYPTGTTVIPVPDGMTPINLSSATTAFSFLGITVEHRNKLLVAKWKNVGKSSGSSADALAIKDDTERKELIEIICYIVKCYVTGTQCRIQMCCNCPIMDRRKKIIKGVVNALGWRLVKREKLCVQIFFHKHKNILLQMLPKLSTV